jgi:signal transduction histidine kinase
MINKLRKRFVKIAILGLLVVTVVFVCSSIFTNYSIVANNEEKVLRTLTDYYGKRGTTATLASDVPFENRYFVVIYDQNGNLVEMNTTKVTSISNKEAMKYGTEALHKKAKTSMLDDLRYEKTSYKNETIIVFLNCQANRMRLKELMGLTIIVSVISIVIFIVMILFASKKVVKPFVEANERQRMFISDAGHDLKTPITIIDADAEVLKSKFGENEFIGDIKTQANRLKTLTEDLIFLSKLDENPNKYQMMDFPLSDIAVEICQSYESLATTQHKGMHVTIEPNISFCGDQKSIERLMSVLLDNAVKYCLYHGEIEVTLEKQKRFVIFTVHNTCDNLSKEDIPHLFDRFYRSDKSRNSETGGYGIGLSIAKSVVEAHKGKISATSSDGKSLAIIVILPCN